MSIITTILAIPWIILGLWFIRTIRATLFHVYLWQLKEYRFDRLIDHLRLKRARQEIFSKLWYARLVLLFIFPGLSVAYRYTLVTELYAELALNIGLILIPIIFLAEAFETLYLCLKRRLKRPIVTTKASIIVTITILSQIMILGGYFFWIYRTKCQTACELDFEYFIGVSLASFLLTFILPFTVVLLVICFKPITFLAKYYFFKKATQKITQFKNLTVIGITGSYGKTSTKEFLYTILSQKYNVLKTEKHVNTEIGVAQTVLKKLKSAHQIFIVEMGAYKRGEIKTICDIVKPKVGILTGINEQHVSLFGSLENIKKGKFELIESLSKNGLAIFNGDNEHCQQLAKQTQISTMIFSVEHKADVYADQIDIKPTKLNFLLYFGKNYRKVETPLAGQHNIPNILAAACAALYVGMSLEEVGEAIKNLQPIEKTMAVMDTAKDITIIDDSYNANPDGVIAAIDHFTTFPPETTKVIIMPSMLELGSESRQAHERVGQKIGQICDIAIFLDNEEIDNLTNGIKKNKSPRTIIFQENKTDKILNVINQHIKKPTVILFESRGAEKVIENLKNL